ncbi:MAG TPA: YceH family protein [Solirubrobacteraceae bacterium]|nr:YceH family protein [Solirubrobacteraceae bacterium]
MSTGTQAFAAGGTLLSSAEARVLGCLLEKQRTTPDQYPLSLNALRLACNQSTNRDPVVDYDEAAIRDALHRLERRHLVRFASGSRAAKYRHLLEEVLPLDRGEHAVMAVLLLRGAQTPGELKQRAERMHAFADLDEVHETLQQLIERELVRQLERRPGQKEERYGQLLQRGDEGATVGAGAAPEDEPASDEPAELRGRVERLEREVAELRAAMRNPSPGGPPNPTVPQPSEPQPSHDPRRFDPRL